MSFAQAHLRALADRIDRLDAEITTLNADKSEVYKEAKANGFDVKPLRAAIARRRKVEADPDAVEEADAILEMYLEAILPKGVAASAPGAVSGPARGHSNETIPTRGHAREAA